MPKIYNPNKRMTELYAKYPPTHEETIHGWTSQKARCGYAKWWDCSFWCGNPKLNKENRLCPGCRMHPFEPDFERCKKMRRPLS